MNGVMCVFLNRDAFSMRVTYIILYSSKLDKKYRCVVGGKEIE